MMAGSRRRWLVLVGAAALLASCGSVSTQSDKPHPSDGQVSVREGGGQLHWIIAASGLEKLKSVAGASFIAARFDSPGNYVVVGATPPAYLASWHANIVVDSRSLAGLKTAIASRVGFVLFDIEDWRFTPTSQASDPISTLSQAAALAASSGSRLIAAPALDLAKLIAGRGTIRSKFLASGILGAAAKGSWAIDIQAQSLEMEPSVYRSFVATAAAQIAAVNPNVRIFAGLSTNPSGRRVSAAELAKDVAATRSMVYGYWLNVPSGGSACPACGVAQPEVLVQLLSSLA